MLESFKNGDIISTLKQIIVQDEKLDLVTETPVQSYYKFYAKDTESPLE